MICYYEKRVAASQRKNGYSAWGCDSVDSEGWKSMLNQSMDMYQFYKYMYTYYLHTVIFQSLMGLDRCVCFFVVKTKLNLMIPFLGGGVRNTKMSQIVHMLSNHVNSSAKASFSPLQRWRSDRDEKRHW